MGDRYQVMAFIGGETLDALGVAAMRGYLKFDLEQRLAGLGYTPAGEVGMSWNQLSEGDAALINATRPEPVFTIGPPRDLAAGDWCARAWVKVAEDVPLDEKLGRA